MVDRSQIEKEMSVRTSDGYGLGRIIACDEERFRIGKGIFFREDLVAPYELIAEVRGDEVILFANRQAMLAADSALTLARQRRRGEEPAAPRTTSDDEEKAARSPGSERRYGAPRDSRGAARRYAGPERDPPSREQQEPPRDEGDNTAWRLPEGDDGSQY